MRNPEIEKKMYELAIELIEQRYPTGWGGAAVIHTDKDHYFTSVAIETANGSAGLCIEVGAMCEAHKYNEKVTHCLCVTRDDEKSPYKILSPAESVRKDYTIGDLKFRLVLPQKMEKSCL